MAEVEVGVEVLEGKLAKLAEIEKALTGDIYSIKAFLITVFTCSTGLTAFLAAYSTLPNKGFAIYLGILSGLGAGLFLYRRLARNQKPYVEMLDDLLAEYEPIDEVAYVALQDDAKGGLARATSSVGNWIAHERKAIRVLLPKPQGPGTKFINKAMPSFK